MIDSGAPRHMCHSYRSGAQTRSDPDGGVTSASGHHLSTLGYVDLGTPLSNVQVVPNIKWNLFSVPQYLLDQGGGGVLFTKDSVISIPSNDTTLADLERNGPLLGQRHSRSYILYHRRANGDVVPAMPHLQPRPEQQESTRAWAGPPGPHALTASLASPCAPSPQLGLSSSGTGAGPSGRGNSATNQEGMRSTLTAAAAAWQPAPRQPGAPDSATPPAALDHSRPPSRARRPVLLDRHAARSRVAEPKEINDYSRPPLRRAIPPREILQAASALASLSRPPHQHAHAPPSESTRQREACHRQRELPPRPPPPEELEKPIPPQRESPLDQFLNSGPAGDQWKFCWFSKSSALANGCVSMFANATGRHFETTHSVKKVGKCTKETLPPEAEYIGLGEDLNLTRCYPNPTQNWYLQHKYLGRTKGVIHKQPPKMTPSPNAPSFEASAQEAPAHALTAQAGTTPQRELTSTNMTQGGFKLKSTPEQFKVKPRHPPWAKRLPREQGDAPSSGEEDGHSDSAAPCYLTSLCCLMDTINQSSDPEPWEHAFYNARAAKMVSDLTGPSRKPSGPQRRSSEKPREKPSGSQCKSSEKPRELWCGELKDIKGKHKHLRWSNRRPPPGPCPICQTQHTAPSEWHWRAACPRWYPRRTPRSTDSWEWEDPTWSPSSLLLLQSEEEKLKTRDASHRPAH